MAGLTGVRATGGGIQIRYQVNGRAYTRWLNIAPTEASLQDAARLRRKLIEDARLGTPEQPLERITFEDACKAYLKDVTRERKPSTADTYRRKLATHWSSLAHLELQQITLAELKKADRANTWTTQKTRKDSLSALSGVFRWAMDEGYITGNPVRLIKVGKHQKPDIDPFTHAEIAAVFPRLRGTAAAFYALMLQTGCRTGELCALRWDDVEEDAIRIRATMWEGQEVPTKTSHARRVLLTQAGRAILKEHTASRFAKTYVFLTQHANPYQVDDTLTKAFRAACAAAGVRYRRPYTLRHTYASRALTAGVEPSWLAEQMGDNIETVLRHYARWIGADRGARELAKLEANWQGTGKKSGKSAKKA
jgi:integrase